MLSGHDDGQLIVWKIGMSNQQVLNLHNLDVYARTDTGSTLFGFLPK